jgi:predicted nucleotidyltransferase component of viral defense system
MLERTSFSALVDQVMQESMYSAMRPVIEKELLHYDIFHALDSGGLLANLVFQGGTSLRLCRGSKRFSEDLDFAGGRAFSTSQVLNLSDCIQDYIGNRYGLLVTVKEPKETALDPDYENVNVSKWQISIETAPQRKDIPRQKIKVEIANIPAYTKELVILKDNYPFLAGRGELLVNAESINEIMADKLIAFVASVKNIRYRDIWDLAWLMRQGAHVDIGLVNNKINDYRIVNYNQLLNDRIESIPYIVSSPQFRDQMIRFIDSNTVDATFGKNGFGDYLTREMTNLFSKVRQELTMENSSSKFSMDFGM